MSDERIWIMHDYAWTLNSGHFLKYFVWDCINDTVVNCQHETRSTKILVGPLAMLAFDLWLGGSTRCFQGWVKAKGMVESDSIRAVLCSQVLARFGVAIAIMDNCPHTSTYRVQQQSRWGSPYTNTTVSLIQLHTEYYIGTRTQTMLYSYSMIL